ncbi:33K [Baboon adenovirus 3]|uniref:33K n=1 Tax=Simian mastadenovirus C TaxID=1962300 RepID=M9YZ77_9ADEN|nr:33K [Baboon adenovirus 3]AGK27142.1 33K [Baboon adenovirus 3]AGK27214.1 33K [Simian mastadenovirus C]
MPPKGVKQLIAQQRAKKQQELLRHMEEEEEASDAWDSQAEEASEDEEMEGWDSLDEVEEEEEVEDEPIGEKPPASSALSPSRLAKTRVPTPGGSRKASRRWDTTGSPKKSKASSRSATAFSAAKDSPAARELRNRIFPTLYAIFQQSRGQQQELKIKNRSLRSLTRSCLYHRREDQLQRTLDDAEALFNKYCSVSLKD